MLSKVQPSILLAPLPMGYFGTISNSNTTQQTNLPFVEMALGLAAITDTTHSLSQIYDQEILHLLREKWGSAGIVSRSDLTKSSNLPKGLMHLFTTSSATKEVQLSITHGILKTFSMV